MLPTFDKSGTDRDTISEPPLNLRDLCGLSIQTCLETLGSQDKIDDNSSDEKDYSPEQQVVALFPKLTVNQEPSRRDNKVTSLKDKDHAALMSKAASVTDISDASSDESTIDYVFPTTGSSSTPAHEVGLSQVLKLRGGSFAGLKIKR